jgi:hypothetical protein
MMFATRRSNGLNRLSACFLATRFAARTLLRSLNAIVISDGELAALSSWAANAMLTSLEMHEPRGDVGR